MGHWSHPWLVSEAQGRRWNCPWARAFVCHPSVRRVGRRLSDGIGVAHPDASWPSKISQVYLFLPLRTACGRGNPPISALKVGGTSHHRGSYPIAAAISRALSRHRGRAVRGNDRSQFGVGSRGQAARRLRGASPSALHLLAIREWRMPIPVYHTTLQCDERQ